MINDLGLNVYKLNNNFRYNVKKDGVLLINNVQKI